ncbi:MAG: ATP-binding protein, partial [Proteobacteria bacterium]|nr:ATP-binding protein [Pseudomonadota bacterium]
TEIISDRAYFLTNDAVNLLNLVFTHLLSNAMDHGKESEEMRILEKKDPQGSLTLRLVQDRDSEFLLIYFADDGKGMDFVKIGDIAVERKIISDARTMTPTAIAELIFADGFSTSEKLSEVSGRGIGMAVVRSYLQESACSIGINLLSPSRLSTHVRFEFVLKIHRNFWHVQDA